MVIPFPLCLCAYMRVSMHVVHARKSSEHSHNCKHQGDFPVERGLYVSVKLALMQN